MDPTHVTLAFATALLLSLATQFWLTTRQMRHVALNRGIQGSRNTGIPMTYGEAYQTLPFVRPGGEILLRVSGWPKVERDLPPISWTPDQAAWRSACSGVIYPMAE